MRKCMYCGKRIIYGNNPEDYGLHTPYMDFSGKYVCSTCDFVVTQTDRILKKVIDSNGNHNALELLERHVNEMKALYKENK